MRESLNGDKKREERKEWHEKSEPGVKGNIERVRTFGKLHSNRRTCRLLSAFLQNTLYPACSDLTVCDCIFYLEALCICHTVKPRRTQKAPPEALSSYRDKDIFFGAWFQLSPKKKKAITQESSEPPSNHSSSNLRRHPPLQYTDAQTQICGCCLSLSFYSRLQLLGPTATPGPRFVSGPDLCLLLRQPL